MVSEYEKPVFKEVLPITKPYLPSFERVKDKISEIFSSGMITNYKYVKELESDVSKYMNVKNAIAVSSCTSGLMLVEKLLNLTGEVILPSFTFSATGHSLMWNNLKPVFVDIDPNTFLIDTEKIEEAITPKTSAILAVHTFGLPSEVKKLQEIADANNLKLIFDSAHAFGSKVDNKYIGQFGDAEVFSSSPTKLMTTGEGGLVTTNNDELAKQIRIGRNYGDDGSYDCKFIGMNARMAEFNAILGIESLKLIEDHIRMREKIVEIYQKELKEIPLAFQRISSNYRTTFKDFAIILDEKEFGLNRDKVAEIMRSQNIITKKYFYPLHKQTAYSDFINSNTKLPITDKISQNILCLPLYAKLSEEDVKKVCYVLKSIYDNRDNLK